MPSHVLRDPGSPVPPIEPAETARLRLRPTDERDVDALWRRRNDETTAAFQSWDVPYPRERAEELVAGMVGHDGVPPVDGWFQIAVDDRTTGEPLGDLALHLTSGGRCAEIGYTFAPAARGGGYTTEAAEWLVAWCFDELGTSHVSASMHPDNVASARVAERIGMEYEGRTRNSFWLDRADGRAENSDDVIYAATDESWRAWQDRPTTVGDVRLVDLTHDNVLDALRLRTHRTQEQLVAPMAVSIAEAHRPAPHDGVATIPWARLVEADGEPVGFVMVAEPDDASPAAYLWRLLIDRMHQRRGIGRRVLELVEAQARAWGAPSLDVSWGPGPGSPEAFYRAHGFVPTGELDDGEIAARLAL